MLHEQDDTFCSFSFLWVISTKILRLSLIVCDQRLFCLQSSCNQLKWWIPGEDKGSGYRVLCGSMSVLNAGRWKVKVVVLATSTLRAGELCTTCDHFVYIEVLSRDVSEEDAHRQSVCADGTASGCSYL